MPPRPSAPGPSQPDTALAARLDRLERLAHGMDSAFRVPGTDIRFGWDAVLGLLPGLGDVATLAPASLIWLEGHRMGAPRRVKARMAVNIGVDWAMGLVPLLGDVADVAYKGNRRNVRLLREHFGVPSPTDDRAAPPEPARRGPR